MIGALVEAFFHWVGKKRKLIKARKNQSIVQLMYCRMQNGVEEIEDGIKYRYDNNKNSIICDFILEIIQANNKDNSHDYESLILINGVTIPFEYHDRLDKIDQYFNNNEFFYDGNLSEKGYMIHIGMYVVIDYENNPLGQLDALIEKLHDESNRIGGNYKRWIY